MIKITFLFLKIIQIFQANVTVAYKRAVSVCAKTIAGFTIHVQIGSQFTFTIHVQIGLFTIVNLRAYKFYHNIYKIYNVLLE